MTIGDVYDKLQEITALERTRGLALGSCADDILGFRKPLTSEEMKYLQLHNNILITEKSTEADKKLHEQIEEINRRIDMLKNIEI